MTSSISTFLSLGSFYRADDRRARSTEHDLGLWWRSDRFNGPTYRAAWVQATGEVYLMQHEGLSGGGHVRVLVHRHDLDGLLAELAGFDEVCGELGSLAWLLERLGVPSLEETHRAPALAA